MSKNIVIGAGISGLSAALFLAQRQQSVELWESASAPGGLLRPVYFRGVPCDLGSHRVLPEAKRAFSSLPGVEWRERPRRGALILRQRHIEYPPSLGGFLWGLGASQSLDFGLSLIGQRASRWSSWERDRADLFRGDVGFARFVTERAGRAAYEAFYRPYAEKLFGGSAQNLSQSIAKKRVSTEAPLRALLRSFVEPPQRFFYPSQGMGALIEALKQKLSSYQVQLQYGKTLTPGDLPPNQTIFYSGYPDALIPETKLTYRGLYLLYLAFPVSSVGEIDTYYTPERRYWFGRVSEPQNFSEQKRRAGESTLCVEIPQGDFGTGEDFLSQLDRIVSQLRDAKIIPKNLSPKDAKQLYLPRVYPLYQRGWLSEWLDTMRKLSQAGNLFPIGRQGLFLHCNIDHCVQISADAVDHMLNQKSAAQWIEHAVKYLEVRVRD